MNKIKLLHAAPFYGVYIKKFYAEHPGLEHASYDRQYSQIMDDCFAMADFWKKNLEETGLFEVTEVLSNIAVIQKKWASEHNISYSEEKWPLDILEAQISTYKPDILFLRDINILRGNFAARLKKKLPFLKKILIWDGIARNDASLFAGCDVILCSLETTSDFYRRNGFQAFYLQHGFETSILQKIRPGNDLVDCSFIGSTTIGSGKHKNRLDLLGYLSKHVPIDIRAASLPSYTDLIKVDIKNLLSFEKTGFFDINDFLNLKRVKNANKGEIFGLDMYQHLADSKMTLNMHLEKAGNHCGNMRMFEATGVGTCLVTDWKENLKDFFEIGTEVVAYTSKEDCVEKIRYLLDHPAERRKIAKRGQERTLRDHNLKKIIGGFGRDLIKML